MKKMSKLRHLCIGYPYLYNVDKNNSTVLNDLMKERTRWKLDCVDKSYDNLDLDYISIEEYIWGAELHKIDAEYLPAIYQQLALILQISRDNTKCRYLRINENNVRCRILKEKSQVRYIIDGKAVWVKTNYIPIIVGWDPSKVSGFETKLNKYYHPNDLGHYTTKTPKRGIFWKKEDPNVSWTSIVPHINTYPTKPIQILYRFYSGNIGDRSDEILVDKYRELVNVDSLILEINNAYEGLDVHNYLSTHLSMMSVLDLIKLTIDKLYFMKKSDRKHIKAIVDGMLGKSDS